jgi:arabinose-5-phosphate isomerase
VPRVAETALLADALMEMTRAGMGMTAIVGDGDGDRIIGIYTDGDLRRSSPAAATSAPPAWPT